MAALPTKVQLNLLAKYCLKSLASKHSLWATTSALAKAAVETSRCSKPWVKTAGMAVKSTESFKKANARVSSTAIREALRAGDLELAKAMLGHDYAISGCDSRLEKRPRAWFSNSQRGSEAASLSAQRCLCGASQRYAHL